MFVFAWSSINVLYRLHLPDSSLLLSSLICSAHTAGDPGTEFLLTCSFLLRLLRVVMWNRYMHPLYILLLPHWPLALLGTHRTARAVPSAGTRFCGPPLTSLLTCLQTSASSDAYSNQIVTGPLTPTTSSVHSDSLPCSVLLSHTHTQHLPPCSYHIVWIIYFTNYFIPLLSWIVNYMRLQIYVCFPCGNKAAGTAGTQEISLHDNLLELWVWRLTCMLSFDKK